MRSLALMPALLLSGCFALVRGGTQLVIVESRPPGARVTFAGVEGVTPCGLEVPRSSDPAVFRIELDGRMLEQKIPAVGWSDASSGLLLGLDIGVFIGIGFVTPLVVDLVLWEWGYDWPGMIFAVLPGREDGGELRLRYLDGH